MLTCGGYIEIMCSFVTLRCNVIRHMTLIETLASNSLIINPTSMRLDHKNPN